MAVVCLYTLKYTRLFWREPLINETFIILLRKIRKFNILLDFQKKNRSKWCRNYQYLFSVFWHQRCPYLSNDASILSSEAWYSKWNHWERSTQRPSEMLDLDFYVRLTVTFRVCFYLNNHQFCDRVKRIAYFYMWLRKDREIFEW